MNATVLAALITGAAGLIGGALAVYFTQRRHNETREAEAQRREAEARSQAEEAHRRAAVAYLKIIEETIEGMRDQLAESQIFDYWTWGQPVKTLTTTVTTLQANYLGVITAEF